MTTVTATSAASTTDLVTRWVSKDGQSSIDMAGATAAEAVAELLSQCGDNVQRAAILAGSFVVADRSWLDAIARYKAIDGLTVHDLGAYLLVRDGATSFFVESADVTAVAMDAYGDDANGPEAGQAWSLLCSEVAGLHACDVPTSVRDAARVELGDDVADDDLTWGW